MMNQASSEHTYFGLARRCAWPALLLTAIVLLAGCVLSYPSKEPENPLVKDLLAYKPLKGPKAFAMAGPTYATLAWGYAAGSVDLEAAKESALRNCETRAQRLGGRLGCVVTFVNNEGLDIANFEQEAKERLALLELRRTQRSSEVLLKFCATQSPPPPGEYQANDDMNTCYLAQLLHGTWRGKICTRYGMELEISGLTAKTDKLEFMGTVRVTYDTGRVAAKVVRGFIRLRGGFIHTEPGADDNSYADAEMKSLRMDLARNASGTGLVGGVDGFLNGCTTEISRVDGVMPDRLPKPTATLVLAEQNENTKAFTARGLSYWLRLAESTPANSATDDYNIARKYVLLAKQKDVGYYKSALRAYQAAANQKPPHASAQAELSVMYAKGLGTDQNPKESARWRELATPTMTKAAKVCDSKAAMQKIARRLTEMGTYQLLSAAPSHVYTIDKPFECTYVFGRPDVSVELHTAPVQEDPNVPLSGFEVRPGQTDLLDAFASQFATKVLRQPRTDVITVTPLGANRYRLAHEDQSPAFEVVLK